jgi:NAD(P)H-quinone oxidoreductase subunit 5
MHAFIALLPAIALAAAACVCFVSPGFRPRRALVRVEIAAFSAFAAAMLAGIVLVAFGPATTPLLGLGGLGLAWRLDAVSAIMLGLVSFIGWVVLRYAATYLDGEAEQGRFTGWIAATLAAVMLLVAAGNLLVLATAWIATGVGIHKLLLFYAARPQARRAARKMLVASRAGDVALLLAAGSLWWVTGTGDITAILAQARADVEGFTLAALLLALAALLKSAQFPAHGWLTEVMEAPTPVSALLHAGVINAGGFLLIRFADVMMASPASLAVLVAIGGFTALFAGMVMLTQTAVKTSLAWSTIAQMGFMILQCGLTLFPLALLHIVAHSFYKAHAFLSSGEAVQQVSAIRRPGPVAAPDARAVGKAFLIAIVIYAAIGWAFGYAQKPPQALALGAILIFGVAYLIAQGLADAAPRALTWRTAAASVAAAISYFALQSGADWVMAGTLPPSPALGPLEWVLLSLAVLSFALVAAAQTLFPLWAFHPAASGLRIHLTNGLYANALLDRLLRGWAQERSRDDRTRSQS